MSKHNIHRIMVAIAFTLVALAVILGNQKWNAQSLQSNFEKGITQLINDVISGEKCIVESLKSKNNPALFFEKNQCLFNPDEIGIFIYDNSGLQYWSSNEMIPTRGLFSIDTAYFEQSNSGYFYIKNTVWNQYFIIVQGLIKRDYIINNDYLENNFSSYFKLANHHLLEVDDGTISLVENSLTESYRYPITAMIFLFIAIVLIYALLFDKVKKTSHKIAFISVILIARILSFIFAYPSFLHQTKIFSPEFYAASEWLPSLGDLWLNIFCLVAILNIVLASIPKRHSLYTSGLFFFSGILLIFLVVETIITNSIFYLNIGTILDWKLELFITFGLIILLVVFFFTHTYRLIPTDVKLKKSWKGLIPSWILAGLYFSPDFVFNQATSLSVLLSISAYFLLVLSKNQTIINSFIYKILPALGVISLSLSLLILHYNKNVEKEKRIIIASKLANQQDPVAEYLFSGIKNQILADSVLLLKIENKNIDDDFFERIAKNYFSGYWLKYGLDLYIFEEFDSVGLSSEEESPLQNYFKEKLQNFGKAVNGESFYYIEDFSGKINYIGLIKFDTYPILNLYIELFSRVSREGTGYPDLLIDNKMSKPVNVSGYSFARYFDKKLYQQSGDFAFSNFFNFGHFQNHTFNFVEKDGFSHLIYSLQDGNFIVLSRKNYSFSSVFNSFSYLFVILIFAFLLWTGLFSKKRIVWSELFSLRINFTAKIQLAFSLVLFVSMIVVGIGAYNYVINQYHTKNKSIVLEKLRSVTFEMELDLMKEEELNYEDIEFLNFELSRLSNLFFSDINIYGINGKLISSSRQAVFAESLLSKNMHPEAFKNLAVYHQSEFVNFERIGKLEFLSAYQPIFNEQRDIIGYLNLPYFLKSRELKEELTASFISLLNVYSILILISLFIVLFLSERITEPLRMIREKMQKVSISNTNEQIKYNSNDEIGDLVREYNRMLAELEKSAEILAKTERESAWAEMAKQVAHEVKNPLTPMKLGIQYLDKAWDDQKPDFGVRFKKYKNTLIEQIDTLSRIASEFSDFAKIRTLKKEQLNLTELLLNCVNFAQNERSDIQIIFEHNPTQAIKILADKEHLIRVINNLLKNAIQAISEDKDGKIEVKHILQGEFVLISISDNGNGIDPEIQEKIFIPNFTTKSTGSGLGLAMCKRIVETAGGEIYFKTHENVGTTFYVKLPIN